MMTFLFGMITALGCVYVVFHFLPKNAKGQPELPTTLDAFGQILTHGEQAVIKRFDDFEASLKSERIFAVMSQAFKDAFAAYEAAKDAATAKAVSDAVAAKQAEMQAQVDAAHAAGVQAEADEDAAVVAAATAALTPAPAG